MAKKQNADILVFQQGLAYSREEAQLLIMAGVVYFEQGKGTERVQKPGQQLKPGTVFQLRKKKEYVSRGAYKLLTLLDAFHVTVQGVTALDAGASTGGFTDCLLQHGARKVYAVDVGKNLLHERLLADPRVISLEGVNLRTASHDLLPELVDFIVADVSFISLTVILAASLQWLKAGGQIAGLIKPQFEVASSQTVRGVVRSESLRLQAVDEVLCCAREKLGLSLVGVVPSAVKGAKGNQEYLALWQKNF